MHRVNWLRRVVASVVASGAVALCGCNGDTPVATRTTSGKCQLVLLADLPARVSHDTVLAPVLIDGKHADISFDIGPLEDYVFTEAMARAGIPQLYGYEDPNHTRISMKIGDLDIGKIQVRMRDYSTSYYPPSYRGLYAAGWSGSVGSDVLSHFDVEFDLAEGRLMLFKHNTCQGPVQHWSGLLAAVAFKPYTPNSFIFRPAIEAQYQIRFPVTVNGHPANAALSSTGPNFLQWSVARQFGIQKTTPGVTKVGQDDPPHFFEGGEYRGQLAQMIMPQATLSNLPVTITSRDDGGDERDHLVTLGVEFLQKNRVYIAYADRMVYFTPYSPMPQAGK